MADDIDDLLRHQAEIHDPAGYKAPRAKSATSTGYKSSARSSKRTPISQVGKQTGAGLACPKCGGVQFTAKRSMGQKLALGVASLAVKGKQVRCVTCGTIYKRG